MAKYIPTEEEIAFAAESLGPQSIEQEPSSDEQSTLSSYWNAGVKGVTQGVKGLINTYGQMYQPSNLDMPGNEIGSVYGFELDKDLAKTKEKGKFRSDTPEEEAQLATDLEQKLPSKEGFVEGVIQRGGKIGPAMFGGPGSLLQKGVQTAGAAIAGETTQALGGGKGAQTIAEILAMSAPNLHRHLLGRNARQQELIDFGRARGMSEAEMVPAVTENGPWRRFLARISNKGQSTQDKLEASRTAVNDIIDDLSNSPHANSRLPAQNVPNIIQRYSQELNNLPVNLRNQIMPELRMLANSNGTANDIMRFYRNVNYGTSDPRRIQGFQDVTKDALDAINHQLGYEFRTANALAHNRYNAAHLLRPTAASDTAQSAKKFSAIYGLISGDYPLMKAALGFIGASKAAEHLLLNPRLQNLSAKMVQSINSGRTEVAQKLLNQFKSEFKDEAPDFYEQIKDFTVQDFNHKSEE